MNSAIPLLNFTSNHNLDQNSIISMRFKEVLPNPFFLCMFHSAPSNPHKAVPSAKGFGPPLGWSVRQHAKNCWYIYNIIMTE
jgi:hypothetical protein